MTIFWTLNIVYIRTNTCVCEEKYLSWKKKKNIRKVERDWTNTSEGSEAIEKLFGRRWNEDQKVDRSGFQWAKLPTTLDACVYTASRFKGAVFSAVLSPQKRITIPNAFEEAFVISSGTCSFIKISRSVFAIPFLPMNSPLSLEYVPFNRQLRTAVQCTRCRLSLYFSALYCPVSRVARFARLDESSSRSVNKNFPRWTNCWHFEERAREICV